MKNVVHGPRFGESGAQALGSASGPESGPERGLERGSATRPHCTHQATHQANHPDREDSSGEGTSQGVDSQVKRDTQAWLEQAVIGLNLCPFAKKVWREGLVRWSVYAGDSTHEALEVLALEIQRLAPSALSEPDPSTATEGPSTRSAWVSPTQGLEQTTLLILPGLCADFWDFLALVQAAQRVLKSRKCVGVLQIAHFHPAYQFAHTQESDPENYINRSPYPTLHLLRERDIEWAAQTHPDVSAIYQHNVQRMNEMGHAGWAQLGLPKTWVGAIKGPD
jgi:hypothetical protein